jgi:hypothetical protein
MSTLPVLGREALYLQKADLEKPALLARDTTLRLGLWKEAKMRVCI